MIIVPKIKELILPLSVATRVAGRYRIETQAPGQKRRLRAEFNNLITNNGLDQICNNASYSLYCAVGSGNATPSFTDTALQSLVGSTNSLFSSSRSVQPSSPYFGTLTNTYNFPAGTATGNLAEVGVGATATSLMSRALILNGGGSPTTITVLSSEALYVTYQLQQYVPPSDVTGSVTIAGTAYSYTLRAASATGGVWALANEVPILSIVTAYNGSMGTITGVPSGPSAGADSVSTAGYATGSYTLNYTTGFSLTAGNLSGGISALYFSLGPSNSRGAFQVGLGTAIPKTGSNVLTLNLSTTWGR
jgi:hypothetical protein